MDRCSPANDAAACAAPQGSCELGALAGGHCQATGWPAVATDARSEDEFQGSVAAPYGANVAHILYTCPSRQLVRTVYNEYAVPLKACGGQMDCPLEEFLVSPAACHASPWYPPGALSLHQAVRQHPLGHPVWQCVRL